MRYLTAYVLAFCLITSSNPVEAAEGSFDSNGVKIRYVTEGEGEAVILVHGWMGDSSTWGRDKSGNTKLNTSGTKGFQFIAIDCRGHGKSDKPHDVEKYGPEMAEDLIRLMDHLKIKKAHLVGYSMGTYLCGHVCANHPDRVLSVIYGGQAPLIAGPQPAKDSGEVEAFAKAVENNDLGSYLIAVTPANRPKPSKEQASAIAKLMYGNKDVKAFAAAGLGFKHLYIKEELFKNCKIPTLFIHGSKESDNLKARVASLKQLIEHCTIKVIEDADHMTTLTKPEFSATVREFLNTNRTK